MSEKQEILIRKFSYRDRQEVRDLCYQTAFMGKPASIFFEGDILADALTLYFTDYEPESCFVAVSSDKVVGYLIGSKNVSVLDKVFLQKIAFYLLFKVLNSDVLIKRKNLLFLLYCSRSFLKGEFRAPDFSKEYPATLHINMKEGFRGFDIGSKLISSYLEYLVDQNVPGVHLATMSDQAGQFFTKQGFSLLHESQRSYFRHILGNNITLYIFGKKL